MIYTARGATTVDEWVDHVLADKETSAIEAHIGTFLAEVARIVSGGIKPGSGVDLAVSCRCFRRRRVGNEPGTRNAGFGRSDLPA